MKRFIVLHYKGTAIYYSVDNIVSFWIGIRDISKGYTEIECIGDDGKTSRLVEETPDEIMAKIKGGE